MLIKSQATVRRLLTPSELRVSIDGGVNISEKILAEILAREQAYIKGPAIANEPRRSGHSLSIFSFHPFPLTAFVLLSSSSLQGIQSSTMLSVKFRTNKQRCPTKRSSPNFQSRAQHYGISLVS